MRTLLTVLYFVLALVGCHDGGGTSYVSRVADGDRVIVYGKAHAASGLADFECVASESGSCHFSLFAIDCPASAATAAATTSASAPAKDSAKARAACQGQPFEQLTVAAGSTRKGVIITDAFRLCLGAQSAPLAPDCQPIAATL